MSNLTHVSILDDLDVVLEVLERDGAVVIDGVLPSYKLRRLQNECANLLNKTENCEGNFFGYSTKRVGAMVDKSQVCRELILNPNLLKVMDHFLLPNCSDYQLNLSQLISIGPGEGQQIIHPDDPMFPFDKGPGVQAMVNVMWAVDDFTKENGATLVVPGSHKWSRDRQPKRNEITYAEMKAGSCLVYLGSTRHAGGSNTTLSPRRGLVTSFSLGWLKQSENHFLSISRDSALLYPEELQRLIGYFVHKPNLNMYEGQDPINYLKSKNKVNSGFKDFIPDDVQAALAEFKNNQDVAIGEVRYKVLKV